MEGEFVKKKSFAADPGGDCRDRRNCRLGASLLRACRPFACSGDVFCDRWMLENCCLVLLSPCGRLVGAASQWCSCRAVGRDDLESVAGIRRVGGWGSGWRRLAGYRFGPDHVGTHLETRCADCDGKNRQGQRKTTRRGFTL